MTTDRNGLDVLTAAECLALLKTAHLGRIALTVAALPVVLPVNFAMLDDDILVRTTAGSKLQAAARNAVVAFEVDCVDDTDRVGWSVLVQGVASEITDPDDLDRARQVPLEPWTRHDGHYLKISTSLISGRHLTGRISSWGRGHPQTMTEN